MFTNIFRGCFSFGAKSSFEKSRLQATYAGDTEEPMEVDLQVILNTLSGKDLETRPQVGFATIVSKLETSESREKWNYLMKNLVIFDRCVESRFFLNDIKNLRLPSVDNFTLPSSKQGGFDILVREYFRVIKEKAQLYSFSNSSYNVAKCFKRKYFEKLEVHLVFEEIKNSQTMHERTFRFTDQSQFYHTKHMLIQYIFIYILSLYLNLYSTQYTAISAVTNNLTNLKYEQAIYFQKLYKKFMELSKKTISFIQTNQHIPGFDVDQEQLYSTDERVENCIKDYIEVLKQNRSSNTDLYNKFKVVNLDQETFNKVIEISAGKTPIQIHQNLSNIQEINSANQDTVDISKKLEFSNALKQSSQNQSQKQKSQVEISDIKVVDQSTKNVTDFSNNLSQNNNEEGQEVQIKKCTSTYSQKKVKFSQDSDEQTKQPLQIADKMVSSEIRQISIDSQTLKEEIYKQNEVYGLNVIQKKESTIAYQDEDTEIEISRKSLEMGYSTYIKQKGDQGGKISRLVYDRLTIMKEIAEEDQDNFDQEFFDNFEEVFSGQTQELLNNVKSSLYQQYPISQSQNSTKSPLKGTQKTLQLDHNSNIKYDVENEAKQNPFLLSMLDQFDENNQLTSYENLDINIDWEKQNKFEEQLFSNFENVYTQSTIESENLPNSNNNNIIQNTQIQEQKQIENNQDSNQEKNIENEQKPQENISNNQPKKSLKKKGKKGRK